MSREAIGDDLLSSARAGDARAWEQLLSHFRTALLGFIERLMPSTLRGWIDAQDVLNDTCFEAYRRFNEFEAGDSDSIYRWLATIARHRMVDLVRAHRAEKRGGRYRQMGLDAPDVGGDDSVIRLLQELAVYERTPSRSAMRHELRIVLERSIDRLAGPLREAVRLRHMSGLPFKEVAERMSRTERAVQQLCTRALRELRTDLESASFFI